MTLELPDLDSALYYKLSGSSAITGIVSTRIAALKASSAWGSSPYPFLVFQQITGNVRQATPRQSIDALYQIDSRDVYRDGVANSGRMGAWALHTAVYSTLHNQALTIAGWSNFWLECGEESRFVVSESGKEIYRFAWEIRIRADRS